MTEITLFDAKTYREEYVITKRGKPVAKIVPIENEKKHDITATLKEMDNLKREMGKTGITLEEILSSKGH